MEKWLGEVWVVRCSPAAVRMEAVVTERRRSERSHGCNDDGAPAILLVSFSTMPLDNSYYSQGTNWGVGVGWKSRRLFDRTGRKGMKRPARVCKDADQRERVFAKWIASWPNHHKRTSTGVFFHSRDHFWLRDTEGLVRNGACIVQHGTP